jgi:uncharacterized RDD family membrane protein YckC
MEQQANLLTELETNLVKASTGKRFANYLIDLVVFFLLFFILGVFMAIVSSPSFVSSGFEDGIVFRLVFMVLFALYIGTFEAITSGRSVGKYITGTKVVMEDGSKITASTAFGRGFSRVVPFEAFSALGNNPPNPWHDRWNKTVVIDIKESIFLNNQ